MKKTALILVLAIIVTAFSGCVEIGKNENTNFLTVATGEGYMQEWNSEYMELIAEATYPVVEINGDNDKYPELTKTLKKLNKENEENGKNLFNEIVEEGYNWYGVSDGYHPFSSLKEVKVIRADEKVLSLLFSGYEYRGGMHGIEYYTGENYDSKTGEKLKLTDVINDMKGLSKAVSSELSKHYSDVEFFEDTDISEFMESEYSWTYDYNGITLYFGPYCLAPYAYGTQAVSITYEEYPDLFYDKVKSPSRFASEMTSGIPVFYDTDKDGETEKISYTAFGSEIGEDGIFTINIGDEVYEEEIYFYEADVTLINTEKDTYLYAEFSMDNDYRETRVYSISDKATYVDTIRASTYYPIEGNVPLKGVITNPDKFTLGTRTYILSTVSGIKDYYTGDNGLPVAYDDNYRFYISIELTALKEFDAEIFDEYLENKQGEMTVKAGDYLTYIATDNEKYVWFETEDYKILRKEFTKDGYAVLIDGMEIYDVFEGMFFAG